MNDVATAEITKESASIVQVARGFKISTNEQYRLAGEHLKGIKLLRQKIGETFDPHIKRAYEAHRALVKERAGHEAPLVEAEGVLKQRMLTHQSEQETERRRQEAAAQELARKERERLEARAAKAAAAGKVEKAAELQTRAETVAAPVVAIETPQVAGISTRKTWDYEITNPALLPREYLMPDDKKIGAMVRALKSEVNIPGVRAFESSGIAARSA